MGYVNVLNQRELYGIICGSQESVFLKRPAACVMKRATLKYFTSAAQHLEFSEYWEVIKSDYDLAFSEDFLANKTPKLNIK